MRTFTTTLVTLGACLLALSPSIAAAQDPPRVTVAAGGGISNPFHGDFDFTAPAWEASARASIARHVAVEGFFEQWEHTKREFFLGDVIEGPSGPLGRVARYDQATTYRMRTAGFNVLATGASGGASFFAGGGIGAFAYDQTFTTSGSGCDAAVAAVCTPKTNVFSSSGFTVQGVAELDVTIVPRVQVFGRYLLVLPFEDPGFGHGTAGAGVRITLW